MATTDAGRADSIDDSFDKSIFAGFERAHASGLLRTNPHIAQRRKLDGSLGLYLQHIEGHWAKKRTPSTPAELRNVVRLPVDLERFNFTKASAEERIGTVKAQSPTLNEATGAHSREDIEVVAMVALSPINIAHVLLVPKLADLLPQFLTPDLVHVALQLASRSSRSDFRILFNSLAAMATVNHFHVHCFYLQEAGLQGGFPVEVVERETIAMSEVSGCCIRVDLLLPGAWYIRGLVVSASVSGGSEQLSESDRCALLPVAIEHTARVAGKIVSELQAQNVAHNVTFSCAGGDVAANTSTTDTPPTRPQSLAEIIVMPRAHETDLWENAGLNAGVVECCGLIMPHNAEFYENYTESRVVEIFEKCVALSPNFIADLVAKIKAFV